MINKKVVYMYKKVYIIAIDNKLLTEKSYNRGFND